MNQKTNNTNSLSASSDKLTASIQEQLARGISENDIVKDIFVQLDAIKDPAEYIDASLAILRFALEDSPMEPE